MHQAVALHQQGFLPEAEELYRAILAASPRNVDALRLLGGLYMQMNKPEQAGAYLQKALRFTPNHPEILTNLGVALSNQGKIAEAQACYVKAVRIAPDYSDAVDNLANLHFASGHMEEAIRWLMRSVALKPNHPAAYVLLGQAYQRLNRIGEAVEQYRRALMLAPDSSDILTKLGNLLRQIGQSAEACEIYQKLAALRPEDAKIQLNLGAIFRDRGMLTEALAHYDVCLKLQPDMTEVLVNRAGLLIELNRPEEARATYNQALRLAPDLAAAQWGKSLTLLMQGQYREGWALYESRFAYRPKAAPVAAEVPRWEGSDLTGKRLLIWGEQGLGDVLQFVRYAKLCKAKGAQVTVLCDASLQRLLAHCTSIDVVVTTTSGQDFDYHVPMMSLPYLFGTTLETIPREIPYLSVNAAARSQWSGHFADAPGTKIGVVWAGNPRTSQIDAHATDRQRSLSLAMLQPLFTVQNCRFYSLQKGAGAEAMTGTTDTIPLIDLMPEVTDFMDTAAIIENLDLVISVDTSVVHLAGGLGKPVWVLSRFGGCWRWLQNQPLNPWYPTARIFGQPAPGDWRSCIEHIRQALEQRG